MSEPVTVKVEVVRSVDTARLLGGPLRKFFNRAMLAMHAYAATPGNVPIDQGTLRGTLAPGAGTTKVDSADPPMWAAAGSNLPYGGALNDPVSRDPHYRDGPSAGQPTAGWLSRTLEGGGENIGLGDLVGQLAADIEAEWAT